MKFTGQIIRITLRFITGLLILLFFIFLIFTSSSWIRHWITYPRLEKQRAEIRITYQEPKNVIELEEYKGILHAHTYWSHDSRGTIEEILPAAKQAKLDFLFFSDHPHGDLDTFPRSYHGTYDGIIFEPGTESSDGLMVCPMDSVVLDWGKGQDAIIKQVVDGGGLALYVHTEKPHNWDNPDYQAMEIYNIHTDMLDGEKLAPLIINFAVNGKKYKHWCFRELYDEQSEILANWDSLNMKRKIVGMAAPDAHNNQNIRARYLDNGLVEWVGPNANTIDIKEPGLREKLLCGPPDPAGWVFKFDVDTYFASFSYVNTHIFSDTLTSEAIKNHLVEGHAFIAFENLAEATGFQFYAVDHENQVHGILGDSVLAGSVSTLHATSPYPVQFKLLRNGQVIDQADHVYSYEYNHNLESGNYRIVASLKFGKKWTTWVQTNPIYLFE
ncbi:MAG: hypothetical protein U9R49_02200 [Bacteroidota bacterium]|nr:hypothetical protein [Bacteroidota bacterium]